MPLSRTERIGRDLFRHYFPREQAVYNVRPDWLVNPETGNALEIDIFYSALNLGVEISGIQHGRFIPGLQDTFADFEKQQRHDALKIERCRERDVRLHALTVFDLTEARFDPFIKRLMGDLGRVEEYRRTRRPSHLYAEAEKLSRQKFRPPHAPKKRQPGIIPLLKRMIGVS